MVLVTDKREEVLRAGDCASFPKDVSDGNQLINKSATMAVCLEIGTRTGEDVCIFSDIDMMIDPRKGGYMRKNGMP